MKLTQTNHRDLELWLGVKNDDKLAFGELFNRYWEPLVNFAGIYLPDRSEREEVLQEVFTQLFVKRVNIKIESSFASYLVSFTRNRILNYLRHRSSSAMIFFNLIFSSCNRPLSVLAPMGSIPFARKLCFHRANTL